MALTLEQAALKVAAIAFALVAMKAWAEAYGKQEVPDAQE